MKLYDPNAPRIKITSTIYPRDHNMQIINGKFTRKVRRPFTSRVDDQEINGRMLGAHFSHNSHTASFKFRWTELSRYIKIRELYYRPRTIEYRPMEESH